MTEWVAAAALFGAILAVGSAVLLEFRTVRAVMPVSAREAVAPDAPAGLQLPAVSMPFLLFADGSDMRVGENLSDVMSRLGADAEVRRASVERTPAGERTTRFYSHSGTRFALLFEQGEHDLQPVVAAIYLQ